MLFNECARKDVMRVTSIEWRKVGSLPSLETGVRHPGLAGALAGFHDEVLIIGGGANFPDSMPWVGGKKRYHDELFVFGKKSDNFGLFSGARYKLPFPVAYGASCSTSEGVLYAGGETVNGLVSTVMLVRYDSESGEVIIDHLPDLPYPVANGALAADGNNIYLAGGDTENGVSGKLLHIDMKMHEPGWSTVTDLPYAASHVVLVVAGDANHRSLYLIGGRRRGANGMSDFFSSNVRLDLKTSRWYECAPLPYGISAGTGYSTGSEIVLFGGDRGERFRATEKLLAQIAEEMSPSKKDSLIARKNQVQESHPGFSREILKYSVENDQWVSIGQIPFDAPVTTTAIRYGEFDVLIPSGEIRAGVRTPQILGGTLTFNPKQK